MNCRELVVVNTKFNDKIVNIEKKFQNNRTKNDVNFNYTRIIFFDKFVFQFNNYLKNNFFDKNKFSSFSIKSVEYYIFDNNLIYELYSSQFTIDDCNASLIFKKKIVFENDEIIANVDDNENINQSKLKIIIFFKFENIFEKIVSIVDKCEKKSFEIHR